MHGRFPRIVETALKNRQFVIDGEAVPGVDGISDFSGLHSRRHDETVQLYAFDILALDGEDLRDLPLSTACTENLHPRPEDIEAATCDFAAERRLSANGTATAMREYGTLTEIHERAQVIALMRFYSTRWRPWNPEGRVMRGPSRQPAPAKPPREKPPPKREGRPPAREEPVYAQCRARVDAR